MANGNKVRKEAPNGQNSDAAGSVGLGADINQKIGQQLRLMYREVVEEGIPDRFVEILKRLDENKGDKGGDPQE
jgi:Anti-sigma factor NepR